MPPKKRSRNAAPKDASRPKNTADRPTTEGTTDAGATARVPSFLSGEVFVRRAFAFSIDEEQAYQKLRAFAVADPETYVLEVVLAALASGAGHIDARTGAWSTTLRFDGEPFSKVALETLYQQLMQTGEHGTTRHAHLAAAVVVASHLSPRWVRVRSGGVELLETFDGPQAEPTRKVSACAQSAQTEVTVARRREWRPLQMLRLRDTSEEQVLRQRILAPKAAMTVDGDAIEAPTPSFFVSMTIEREGVRGRLGLMATPGERGPLHLCYRGVSVVTLESAGVSGWLSSDTVKRNISLNDLVRDRAFEVMDRVLCQSTETLELAWLVRRAETVNSVDDLAGRPMVQRLAAKYLGQPRLGPKHPARRVLEAIPLFQTTDEGAICLGELVAAAARERPKVDIYDQPVLPRCTRVFARRLKDQPAHFGGIPVIQEPKMRAPLRKLVLALTRDVTAALADELALAAFLERPKVPLSLPEMVSPRIRVEDAGIRGLLGLGPEHAPGEVRLLYRGRALGRVGRGLVVGLVGVLDVEGLTPTGDYERAAESAGLEAAKAAVMAAQEALWGPLVDTLQTTPPADGPECRLAAQRILWALQHGSQAGSWRDAAARLPLFLTLAGRRRSLLAVIERRAARALWRLQQHNPPEDARELVAQTVDPNDVLLIAGAVSSALQRQVGVIKDMGPPLRTARAATLAQRTTVEDAVDALLEAPERLSFEAGAVRGVVGRPVGDTAIAWVVRGTRILETARRQASWVPPGLGAVIVSDQVTTRFSRDAVLPGTEALGAARAAVAAAWRRWLDAHGTDLDWVRYLVFHYQVDRKKGRRGLKARRRWTDLAGRFGAVELDPERALPDPAALDRPRVPCADGQPRSVRQIVALGRGPVGFVAKHPSAPVALPDGEPVLVLDAPWLEALAPLVSLEDVSDDVSLARTRAKLLAEARPREARLGAEVAGPRRRFEKGDPVMTFMRGEAAFGPPDRIDVLLVGRHLVTLEPGLSWAAVRAVVDVGALKLDSDEGLVSHRDQKKLRATVDYALQRALAEGLRADPGDGALQTHLARLLGQGGGASELPKNRARKSSSWREVFLTTPLFESVSGRRYGLREIAAWGDRLTYVPAEAPVPSGLSGETLRLDELSRTILAKVFPTRTRVNRAAELAAEGTQRQWLDAAPALETAAPESALVSVRVAREDGGCAVSGVAWLAGPTAAEALAKDVGRLVMGREAKALEERPSAVTRYRMEARLESPALALAGTAVAEDAAFRAVLAAEAWAAEALMRRLASALMGTGPGPARRLAGRCVMLAWAAWRWQLRGREAFADSPAVWEAPVWERGDGLGRVSLKTLLEDLISDGEVGFVDAPATDPEQLGRDLAVVCTDPRERAGFEALFGAGGFVDYRQRLRRAPEVRQLERLRHLLDKARRCVPDPRWRAWLGGVSLDLAFDGPGAPFLEVEEGVARFNADHPRWEAFGAALESQRDLTLPLLLVLSAHLLGAQPKRHLAVLEQLAALR